MDNLAYKAGVRKPYLVKRKIRIQKTDTTNITKALEEIDSLFGFQHAHFNQSKYLLTLEYDAGHCSLAKVLDTLAACEVKPKQNWWNRTKLSYYNFTDNNVKENSQKKPWNCHMD